MTELHGSLKDAEKRYKATYDSIKEKALQVEKYQKDVEALNALQHKVVGLR